MDYSKHYELLINKAKNRDSAVLPYIERHHIIPKSENGSDDSSNIVALTAREHFIAHWLLHRMDTSIKSRTFSFWRMCNGRGSTPIEHWITISSRVYEEARLAHSKAISIALKGKKKSLEHARKVGLAVKGLKRTEEQKMKLRKPHNTTAAGKKRLSDARLGITPTNAKMVIMMDKDSLKELKTFKSLKEASDYVQLASSNICMAIKNGGISGEYRWKYIDQKDYVKNISIQEKLGTKINQYDLDGNFIKTWNSISLAAKDLSITNSSIHSCCNNKIKSYKGYIWRYNNSLKK